MVIYEFEAQPVMPAEVLILYQPLVDESTVTVSPIVAFATIAAVAEADALILRVDAVTTPVFGVVTVLLFPLELPLPF